MMSSESKEFFDNSEKTEDPWLRCVKVKNSRINVESYYMFICESEKDLIEKFCLFKPVHTGFYEDKFMSDEPSVKHFTFVGTKQLLPNS